MLKIKSDTGMPPNLSWKRMKSKTKPLDRFQPLHKANPYPRVPVAMDKSNLHVSPVVVNPAKTDNARPVVEDHGLVSVTEGELPGNE